LMAAYREIPPDSIWSAFGIGKEEMPYVAATWWMGGHVRVGLEDNIYVSKGVLAKKNSELVTMARDMIHMLGGQNATPKEAREILHLPR
jgi:uncharacterized protein (DUF849 family)